jgi:uncharacterized protein (TIGR00297 family)
MTDFVIGFILSMLIGVLAYKKESLSESGVLTALVLGTLIFGFAGWFAFLVLISFFVLSSLISNFNPDKKSSRRTAVQVLSNGLIATIAGMLYYVYGNFEFLVLLVASIAMAASDTWSSEIGRLSKNDPRHIFTFKVMKKGLSGGVSLLGFSASILAGFVFSALIFIITDQLIYVFLVFIFAFLGSLIDSMLGTIQAKYRDLSTNEIVENQYEGSIYYSGFTWISNNKVNLLSNLIGVLLLGVYLFYFI